MTNVVRPFRSSPSPCWMSASDSESRLDVASSRMRIRGSASSARAIETRCRCPPESFTPRSPTTVSYPFSNASANSSTRATRQAATTSASEASGREKETFSRIVPSKRNDSCRTTPSCDRNESSRAVERSTPSTVTRPDAGDWNAATRPMMRRLAGARRADERRHRPRLGAEGDAVEDLLPFRVREPDLLEDDLPANRRKADGPPGIDVLRRLREDLLRPLEAGERLGELRPDADDLEDGSDQEPEEDGVGEEAAHGERPGEDLPGPDPHHHDPDAPEEHRRSDAEQRHPGDRLQDVREEPGDTVGEDELLALLAVVPLHDPDPGERFGQPAGNLAVDLRPLAEDGTQDAERDHEPDPEEGEKERGETSQGGAEGRHVGHREGRRDESPHHLDDAGPDEVPDSLDVVHDARDEVSRLLPVEVGDRKARHVRLQLRPKLGNQALGPFREHLRQGERRRRPAPASRPPPPRGGAGAGRSATSRRRRRSGPSSRRGGRAPPHARSPSGRSPRRGSLFAA